MASADPPSPPVGDGGAARRGDEGLEAAGGFRVAAPDEYTRAMHYVARMESQKRADPLPPASALARSLPNAAERSRKLRDLVAVDGVLRHRITGGAIIPRALARIAALLAACVACALRVSTTSSGALAWLRGSGDDGDDGGGGGGGGGGAIAWVSPHDADLALSQKWLTDFIVSSKACAGLPRALLLLRRAWDALDDAWRPLGLRILPPLAALDARSAASLSVPLQPSAQASGIRLVPKARLCDFLKYAAHAGVSEFDLHQVRLRADGVLVFRYKCIRAGSPSSKQLQVRAPLPCAS